MPAPSLGVRIRRALRPSHEHSAFSATLLLMAAVMLSRVIGFVRELYIARTFGAGPLTDAYNAAFTLPDFMNYLLAGGGTSITFISIYTRYRSQGRQEDADRTFSAILSIISAIFVVLTVVGSVFARDFIQWYCKGFTPEQVDLSTAMTRIVLPAQIFFYTGGVVSSVLQSRRMFLLPALSPLLYNLFIILGGVFGAKHFGIESLAIGALAGAVVGPFLVNVAGALKHRVAFRPNFNLRDAGFREWLRMTIPLMFGFSLVTVDDWFLRYFASGYSGEISRLNYAKRLFLSISVLGQAAGMASLPFIARLFGEGKLKEYAKLVSDSVYKLASVSLLLSGWMIAAALPIVDLAYRRGHFTFHDSQTTAVYFAWFALSLPLWSAQALYARAFYATGDTLTPMIGSTAVTIAVFPAYSLLLHRYGITGLAIASDLGITLNTLMLVVLLNFKRLIRIADLNWPELGKAFCAAALGALAAFGAARRFHVAGSRVTDVAALAACSLLWATVAWAALRMMRSELFSALQRRKPDAAAAGEPLPEGAPGAGQP